MSLSVIKVESSIFHHYAVTSISEKYGVGIRTESGKKNNVIVSTVLSFLIAAIKLMYHD